MGTYSLRSPVAANGLNLTFVCQFLYPVRLASGELMSYRGMANSF